MTISDINAQFIVLTPSLEDEGLQYDYIGVAISFNKGNTVSKTISVPSISSWSIPVGIPVSNAVTLTQIYIKNLLTNTEFGLLDMEFTPYTSLSMETLKNLVGAKLFQLGLYDVQQVTVYDPVTNKFTYILTNLPAHLSAHRIEYIAADKALISYFSVTSGTDFIFNNGVVTILPSFLGVTSFAEGIYSITFTGHQTNNVSITRIGCYFLDVTLKCRLLTSTDFDCAADRAYLNFLMLHYSLVTGSNCQCDCNDLYTIYDYLNTHLPVDTNTQDCGCY